MKTVLFLATILLLVAAPFLALLVLYETLCLWAIIRLVRKLW